MKRESEDNPNVTVRRSGRKKTTSIDISKDAIPFGSPDKDDGDDMEWEEEPGNKIAQLD